MRYLSDLVGNDIDTRNLPQGWQQVDVTGITTDSRAVKQGWIFAAIPGVKMDGRAFIKDAVQQGASAILTSKLEDGTEKPAVPVLQAANLRHAVSMMAARFYAPQPKHMAAVTGTDGKTSTAHFYQQLWRLMGEKAASVGTLGVVAPEDVPEFPAVNTTPDPVLLMQMLQTLAQHEVHHVAMEASSHGLDQHRLDGVDVRVAGFTNLTRDHLDYHHTEEAYFHAKLRLFTEVMRGGGVAVLNADERHFGELKQASLATGHKVLGYGRSGDALKLMSLVPHATGQYAALELLGKKYEVDVPLIGAFQVMNILCAAGMAIAEGADAAHLAKAIGKLSGVPGRMEQVAKAKSGAPLFVDYAHTPGGLESVLTHIRPHVKGKLAVVFGCGGDRDRGKRPVMGEIAARLADAVFVTDDNPRSEQAAAIRAEVMAGCPNATEVEGREAAIMAAVAGLQKDDALVIAGKGHEQGQIVGGVTHPFDDAEVARRAAA